MRVEKISFRFAGGDCPIPSLLLTGAGQGGESVPVALLHDLPLNFANK